MLEKGHPLPTPGTPPPISSQYLRAVLQQPNEKTAVEKSVDSQETRRARRSSPGRNVGTFLGDCSQETKEDAKSIFGPASATPEEIRKTGMMAAAHVKTEKWKEGGLQPLGEDTAGRKPPSATISKDRDSFKWAKKCCH